MTVSLRRSAVALLSLTAVAVSASSASAQFRNPYSPTVYTNPRPVNTPYFNPNPIVGPNGLTLGQLSYNTAVLGRVTGNFYRQIPPYAMGYNPYPSPIIAPGYSGVPAYAPPTYNPYVGGSVLAANPYTGGAGAGAGSVLATNGTGYDSTLATPYSNPYVPYGGDPYGGALRGLADLTTASGNYQVTIQQARLANEKVNQARIDTRRKLFDEIRYERMNTPTLEDLRALDKETALTRARRDPPLTEIFSGRSLNELFDHLSAMQGKGLKGHEIRLDQDEEMLKHINLTGGTGGNAGLLKTGGKLSWPVALLDPGYEPQRKVLEENVEEAVRKLRFNPAVDRATLVKIAEALAQLHQRLDASIGLMLPGDYLEAARYLDMLDDTYRALRDPNAGNYITQKWSPRGRTVAELIDFMRQTGLKFAPATPGDEPYYRALHHALTAYDASLIQLVNKP